MSLRMTEEQLKMRQSRSKTAVAPRNAKNAMYALGRLKQGAMNKTEALYEDYLKTRVTAGEVAWYKFEGLKLRLADNTFYSPDFFVMLSTGVLQVHEVKGHWTDDAKVKIKVASALYPFEFIAIKKANLGWNFENY